MFVLVWLFVLLCGFSLSLSFFGHSYAYGLEIILAVYISHRAGMKTKDLCRGTGGPVAKTRASNAEAQVKAPVQGIRSHVLQQRWMILHATTEDL